MRKLIMLALALMLMTSCGTDSPPVDTSPVQTETPPPATAAPLTFNDSYRNVYEIYVGSFYDSNGDGIG
jgi:hypothetical protein